MPISPVRIAAYNHRRYSKIFTTIDPTLFNVCEYWFKKDQTRIRDIRVDALSQILNMANIRPGGRYLAVDDASGLLVSGILERMGGKATNALFPGYLLTICRYGSSNNDLQYRLASCISCHGPHEFHQ